MFSLPLALVGLIWIVVVVVVVVVGFVSVVVLVLAVGLPLVVVCVCALGMCVILCTPRRLAMLEIATSLVVAAPCFIVVAVILRMFAVCFVVVVLPVAETVATPMSALLMVPLLTELHVVFALPPLPGAMFHAFAALGPVVSCRRCRLPHDSPLWGWV